MTATHTPIARGARFWDKVADRYARKPVPDEAVYRRKLAITQGYFTPEMDVLEFGCGTGSTALEHAPFVRRILATDVSGRMIEIARGKARATKIANVRFEQAAIEELDAPDDSFDAVLGLSILHLLADRDAAIAKAHRLLKPGGLFVTSTVCLGDTKAWFKWVGPVGRALGLMPFVGTFTAADLERAIENQGFAIDHRWQPDGSDSLFLVARRAP